VVRRWLSPGISLLIAIGCGAVALRNPAPVAGARDADPIVPVLSVRRAPELLSRFVADGRLAARLDTFFADPALGEGRSRSCLIVDQGGHRIYQRQPATLLTPASNLKLVTALVALNKLGAATTFETVARAARPAAGVIDGPLWIVGGGDPLLATKPYADSFVNQPQLRTPYEDLAAKLVAAGVREIRGGVMGDESRYDTERYLPSWRRAYITEGHVGPESALALNDGFALFKPAKVAAPAPATYAATVLADLLRAQGVTVTGEAGQARAPADLPALATVKSPPLAEVVGEMLRESDNNTAELLVKELGRRFGKAGSTAAGLTVIKSALADAKLPSAELEAVDGSGLDRSDLASCNLLVDILGASGAKGPIATGLAVAGVTGTLSDRFDNNPAAGRLKAKTGFLDGVVALSGWVEATRGDELRFAFLANGLPIPSEKPAYGSQERLGAALASYPEAPAADELAPGAP
jgi:D-alanyl-D-alanine carboxypeptidase/D-alanyl-D-alanine-endopeptidase (penicillin-binding protein 4)